MLNAENVTVRYDTHTVVDRLSFSLEEGQWLMLAGPNGAGKSSLISAIAQGVPYEGEIRLNGRNLRDFRPAELARKIAVLAQQHTISYGYTVEEIVQLGRYAHQRGLLGHRDEDGPDAIERALELTGMKMLRKKKSAGTVRRRGAAGLSGSGACSGAGNSAVGRARQSSGPGVPAKPV